MNEHSVALGDTFGIFYLRSFFVFFPLQQLDPPEEEQLSSALQTVELELGKLGEIPWLYHILQPNDEEVSSLNKH